MDPQINILIRQSRLQRFKRFKDRNLCSLVSKICVCILVIDMLVNSLSCGSVQKTTIDRIHLIFSQITRQDAESRSCMHTLSLTPNFRHDMNLNSSVELLCISKTLDSLDNPLRDFTFIVACMSRINKSNSMVCL